MTLKQSPLMVPPKSWIRRMDSNISFGLFRALDDAALLNFLSLDFHNPHSSSSSSLSAPPWFWLLSLCLSPKCPCFLWFHLILLLPYSTLSLKSPHTQLQLTATYFQLVWKYLPILHLCSPDLATSWLHLPAAISLEASQVA